MDLYRTLLKDVILPKIRSVFVIDYYEGVRGLLESRSDFPYKEIFANPRIRTKTEILWSSDAFSSLPKTLSELTGEDKEYYSYLLYKEIDELKKLIETLKAESGGASLSELLSKTIPNISEKSVYCGDSKIVLVNWGLIPRQADLEGDGIYRSGKFVGEWDKSHCINPRYFKNFIQSEKIRINDSDTIDYNSRSHNDDNRTISDTDSDGLELTNVVNDNVGNSAESGKPDGVDGVDAFLTHSEHKIPESVNGCDVDSAKTAEPEALLEVPESYEVSADSVTTGATDKSEKPTDHEKPTMPPIGTEINNAETSKVPDAETSKEQESIYGWKELFKGLLKGLCFLFKKTWWIFLLLLLVLGCLFCIRNYQGPINQYNPFYNPLPDKPVIMPIMSGGVGMSSDGLYQVATDRLNIMLEKENDNTMLDWAKAFKKAYPSSDYEIKYYNKDTYILQIKVPSDQRIKVKDELNSKLPDFGFDVFEETVFQADFTADDPALMDSEASWYLNVIGANEAWDLTLGDEDILVAVVDNGFDLTHPEFAGKVISPYNVLLQNDAVRPITTSNGVDAHGTHVAATAVGNCNNASGLLGIAPNCKLMPIQVGNDNPDGSMSSTAVLEGVLYAVNNGADVVNVSLGMVTQNRLKSMTEAEQLNYIASSFQQEETAWNHVFREAEKNNCIIVFAAGNDNVISGLDPKKRNPQTLRVSAIAPGMTKASFSNYGRYPELNRDYSTVSAPGVGIYSAVPGGQYEFKQGTSMAAPVVTGAIALMKSVDNSLSADDAIAILQSTGKTIDPSIGPVIHVGNAVNAAMNDDEPYVDCDKIREEVQRLHARIDSLNRLCPGATAPADTLNYDDVISDPRSLDGTWKSTTELCSTDDMTPVELYMVFSNLSGHLIIVNKKVDFKAPLKAEISGNEIHIMQSAPAMCADSSSCFTPYTYECVPDRKRNLLCNATSDSNTVNFNLVRIK